MIDVLFFSTETEEYSGKRKYDFSQRESNLCSDNWFECFTTGLQHPNSIQVVFHMNLIKWSYLKVFPNKTFYSYFENTLTV